MALVVTEFLGYSIVIVVVHSVSMEHSGENFYFQKKRFDFKDGKESQVYKRKKQHIKLFYVVKLELSFQTKIFLTSVFFYSFCGKNFCLTNLAVLEKKNRITITNNTF